MSFKWGWTSSQTGSPASWLFMMISEFSAQCPPRTWPEFTKNNKGSRMQCPCFQQQEMHHLATPDHLLWHQVFIQHYMKTSSSSSASEVVLPYRKHFSPLINQKEFMNILEAKRFDFIYRPFIPGESIIYIQPILYEHTYVYIYISCQYIY